MSKEKATLHLKSYYCEKEEESKEILYEVPHFPEGVTPAIVRYGTDYTKQVKQYEPIKVWCEITLPCLPHESEIKDAKKLAKRLVEEQINEVYLQLNPKATKKEATENNG